MRVMLREVGITVALAVTLGALVCAAILRPMSPALTGSAASVISAGHVLVVFGGAVVLGLVTVLLTTGLALRPDPARVIGAGR
ncbi:hypothetical protein SSOG_06044 [Streptomyces himastatinicus ATCC 53653]|uniref:Uncharacterized protein n=2 Tax=Streptomyces violaceusniger group TaxID=2839105 RepID=D9WTA9_9ACTN|nr:hypothetical protein SSOG_06044 [Streptomyces himastatinicus ATCC 53653]